MATPEEELMMAEAAERRKRSREEREAAEAEVVAVEENDALKQVFGFTGFKSLQAIERNYSKKRRRRKEPAGEEDAAAATARLEREVEETGGWEEPQLGKRYKGVITKYFPERRFGFIDCRALGIDIFLSNRQMGAHAIGDEVTFMLTFNKFKQPQAQDLEADL
eukprot:Hpha_TRINITY_DN25201_c0_g1::TRINITY_DN25201_c0_g1_i1::g.110775::m.110775